MIEKIDGSQVRDILEKSSLRQPDPPKTFPDNQVDASLQVDYAGLIEKAMQTQQPGPETIQQAEELLMSGQLENPENIREAAESIASFGI